MKTIFITGSTAGLGAHTARGLAEKGATLLLHGRHRDRGERVLQQVREAHPEARHRLYLADFSSLDEVRQLAESIEKERSRLDVLINNAGIGSGRPGSGRAVSRDGHELRFQVNYVAGFLLTSLLLPLLRRSAPARIVNVTSIGQERIDLDNLMLERRYDGWSAYQRSKLAQILLTFELAERLDAAEVTVNAVHPATLMETNMVREARLTPRSSVEEGAQAVLRLALAPEMEGVTGRYFDGMREARAHRQAYDRDARRRLWELSEKLCGVSA